MNRIEKKQFFKSKRAIKEETKFENLEKTFLKQEMREAKDIGSDTKVNLSE